MALGQFSLSLIIGAALSPGFRSAIGEAASRLTSLGSVAAAIGVGKLVSDAAQFEAALLDVAINADKSDQEIAGLRQQLVETSKASRVAKEELLEGFRALVASGMDWDKARQLIEPIGRTAKAANADVKDLAQTAFQLVDTLNVQPGSLAAEIDRLALAGKQGAFELKDMARHLPSLAPNLKALGLEGAEAVATLGAALQVAMKGAGSADEAANNLKNFLAKAVSPETIRNFQDKFVNIPKVIDKAIREGRNPFEAIIEQVEKVVSRGKTVGQRGKILGELFGDFQVQQFMKPMLQNLDEYRALKEKLAASTGGTVEADFARRLGATAEKAKEARIALGNLATNVGNAFLPALGAGALLLSPVVDFLGQISEAAPLTTLGIFGAAAAFKVLGAALIANPIGATITLLSLGALAIIDNWKNIKTFFLKIWEPIRPVWEAFAGFVGRTWERISAPFNALGRVFGGSAPAAAAPRDRFSEAADSVAQAGAAGSRVDGVIRVELGNLPKGTRTEVRSTGSDVALDVQAGYALGIP